MFLVIKLSKRVQTLQDIYAGRNSAFHGAAKLMVFLCSALSRETAQGTTGRFCSGCVVGKIKGGLWDLLGDGKQLIKLLFRLEKIF